MATNIKYLKEHDLYDAHQHFIRLTEAYIPRYPEEELDEAGEEDAPQGPDGMGDGAEPNAMGGDPNAMGDDPNTMNGGADMGGGGPNTMGDDPNMGPDGGMGPGPNMGGADPGAMDGGPDVMGPDMMGEDTNMESDPADDGETIDINGLTKAQEKINVKQNQVGRDLSKVDNRIEKLIDTIQNLQKKLDSNNSEIESLKAEFEKRNPTQTEKLNLRSLDSYPYNVKPNEFWDKKTQEGGYEAYADNEELTTKEYVITNDDVDNPSDDVANTFFKIDDDDIQTLEKMFSL